MGKFELRVDLGNAEMRTHMQVADALEDVARRVRVGENLGNVRDANGNTAGRWVYDAEEDDES